MLLKLPANEDGHGHGDDYGYGYDYGYTIME
jgi:hypothetical protein